jgi:hypothetical protein
MDTKPTTKKASTAKKQPLRPRESSARVAIATSGRVKANAAHIGAELAAVFKRHGITVENVTVTELEPVAFETPDQIGNRVQTASETASARQYELPVGMDRISGALGDLDLVVGEIEKRLEAAGVLSGGQGQNGEGKAEEAPATEAGRRLRELEGRVWRARSQLVDVLNRLEA